MTTEMRGEHSQSGPGVNLSSQSQTESPYLVTGGGKQEGTGGAEVQVSTWQRRREASR